MGTEALALRWVVVLGAALLATGCVTLASPTGGSDLRGPRALSGAHSTSAALFSLETGVGWGGATENRVAGGTVSQEPTTCGGRTVPPGWPDFSSGEENALLAPFLTCSSPAEYVALQRRVDMPRLVEALDEWSAVRLGALGPVREDAAALLQRKRAAFLVSATERYGPFHAEVFTLFVLHSAHDDEVDAVLRLLARDKLLGQTLALMPAVRQELETRGLPLSRYPERAEQSGDVLRGLGRAARDALATSQSVDGWRYTEMTGRWVQLPPAYQQAAHEVERALALRHFSAGNVALGAFDSMTFGVPLGFYYLVAGTSHGAASLSEGRYEQASRELAPALLLGTLYAGGKGLRALSEARSAGQPPPGGLQTMESRLRVLRELARQVEAKLGVEGMSALARDIRTRRDVGEFVAVGGVDAVLALHEARGDVARAQALMSRARPGATGAPTGRSGAEKGLGAGALERTGGLASLVDEAAGLTREVVEARLALVELESPGPRLSRDVAVLEKQPPSLNRPPPGAEGNARWGEYVAYYEKRVRELQQGKATQGPLRWEHYERMWGWFARGLAFERFMVALLEADAALPQAQRRFLGTFNTPRILRNVGVKKPESGLRYADMLIIEENGPTKGPPRVETFSFKSRDLSRLDPDVLKAQLFEDASEAVRKYGGRLDIRRDSLQPLLRGGSEVSVQRIRLVYEGDTLLPKKVEVLETAVRDAERKVPGVEVLFQ